MKDNTPLACPCGKSSDAFAIDPDTGWGHCFSAKCGGRNFPPQHEAVIKASQGIKAVSSKKPIPVTPVGEVFSCPEDRRISRHSAEKYKIWESPDGKVFFPSFDDNGNHTGNKVRAPNSEYWEGKGSGKLFGSWLFPPGSAKAITLVAGEYDAPAAFELLGSKFPCVSVPNGVNAAERDVRNNFEYLNSFEEIVICFDREPPEEQQVAKKVAGLFAPGKVRIFTPREHKDPNDYLKAGDKAAFAKQWWQAPAFMPDGLKIGTGMWDEIVNRPSHYTVELPFQGLNKLTYGLRLSEMWTVTADPKVGKTSLLREIEYALLMNPDVKEKGYGIGLMKLEEPNYDSVLGLMSIHHDKPYHLPDVDKPVDDLRRAYDDVINTNRLVLWDHFGSNKVDAVVEKVRHMAALGCKYIILDHVSIVVSDQSGDERKQLDEIATKLKMLCMNLNIALICVVHQNRQGAIRSSAIFEQISNVVVKLHRDKLDPDPWRRNVTQVVVQENRFCGRTGPACYLWYNEMTGRMYEMDEAEVAKFEGREMPRDDKEPF